MALTSRQTVREEVSALFNGITEVQLNAAYPLLALNGQSPVLELRDDGTSPMFVSKSNNQVDHYFKLAIFINREAHGAEAAENLLDTIWTAVMQACRDQVTGTSFMELVVDDQRSQPQFATIDGLPYRFEEISIMTRSNPNG